jgi:hypothetical protein
MRILLVILFMGCGDDDVPGVDGGANDGGATADSGSTGDSGVTPTGVCEREAGATVEGATVARCEELFAERPFIRPPADRSDATTIDLYAGYEALQATFLDREGTSWVLHDASGPITSADAARLPAGLRWPSYRFLYTVWHVRGERVAPDGEGRPGVRNAIVEPAITIPGEVIDSFALGTWEGTVSRRTGENTFDATDRVRFRVVFERMEPNEHVAVLPEWDEPAVLLPEPEANMFRAVGTIQNWSERVTAADGTCLEAIGTLGAASPFFEATEPTLTLYRYPSMHGPGDHVTVLDYPPGSQDLSPNGMSGLYFNHPAALIQSEAHDPWDRWSSYPHATPNGHAVEAVVKVDGGGAPCS